MKYQTEEWLSAANDDIIVMEQIVGNVQVTRNNSMCLQNWCQGIVNLGREVKEGTNKGAVRDQSRNATNQ